VCQKLPNRAWFDKVIAKIKWCSFFDSQCSYGSAVDIKFLIFRSIILNGTMPSNDYYICFTFCFVSDQEKLDKAPTSFYVIKVDAKSPCLILKAAFLRGTPGKQRKEVRCI